MFLSVTHRTGRNSERNRKREKIDRESDREIDRQTVADSDRQIVVLVYYPLYRQETVRGTDRLRDREERERER